MSPTPHSQASFRLMVILAGLVLVGGFIAAYLLYLHPIVAGVGQATGQLVPREPVTTSPEKVAPAPTATIPSLSGTARINILLLGSDTDPKFLGVYDTQIMMVVSIDPVRKRVAMLSIPRDLWVPIPGRGIGKVGTAYHDGGLALARQTIETDFGIPIHFYAWAGLDGFIKVIDTFGGVDVDVSHPIVDDAYPDDVGSPDPYAYRRLYIPAGLQHLDGASALEYVRSRHGDLIGDFGRSQRQQQVLDALRSEVNGKDVIPKLPQLATELGSYLRTDMAVPDLVRFAAFADQIRSGAIDRYTLAPPRYSRDGSSTDGQSIVVPNWPAIRALIDSIFDLDTARSLRNPVEAYVAPNAGPEPPRLAVTTAVSTRTAAVATTAAGATPTGQLQTPKAPPHKAPTPKPAATPSTVRSR
ncbi:MAG: LCP family protein [Chloroflexota bacterium]|nr:LCP family protein [Chloroflexota bacterium]